MKKVICGGCNTHVYDYILEGNLGGTVCNPDLFRPIGNYPQPVMCEKMKCPECKTSWNPYDIIESENMVTVMPSPAAWTTSDKLTEESLRKTIQHLFGH